MLFTAKKYINLTVHMVSRDIRERYAGSYLGVIWSFLYPVFFLIIYWFVFSKVMQVRGFAQGDAYLPFLLCGLFPWFAIQEGIMRGTTSIIEKGYILKKVLLPQELFPLSANISALFHHSIGFLVFLLAYFLWKGIPPFQGIVSLPMLYVLQLSFSVGISLLLSAVTVYFRDLTQITGIALQGIFFLSPILYPPSALPDRFQFIIRMNPLSLLLEGYRTAVIAGKMPDPSSLLSFALFTSVMISLSIFVFRRLKDGFADVL